MNRTILLGVLALLTGCRDRDISVPARSSLPPSDSSAAPVATPASRPSVAEYAVRWDPAHGGPQTAKAVMDLLGKPEADSDRYEVVYLSVTAPSSSPPGYESILRERKKGATKFQLTFKYRGPRPFPGGSDWLCPLPGSVERKDEVDVSIVLEGDPRRTYSRSCTVKSGDGPVVIPIGLNAKRPACSSKMLRLEAGGLKVEEWQLGGETVIEVSRSGLDTLADLDSFRNDVVGPLVKAKAKPVGQSKTELGTSCN